MPKCLDCGKDFNVNDIPQCSYERGYIDCYNYLEQQQINKYNEIIKRKKNITFHIGEQKPLKSLENIKNLLDKLR